MILKELQNELQSFPKDVSSNIILLLKQKVKPDTNIDDKIVDSLIISTDYKNKIKKIIKNFNTEQNGESLKTKLLKINGIGETKAMELIQKNLTDIRDLEKKEFFDLLSKEAQLFVKLKPITVIPRQYIKLILDQFTKFKFVVAGSYLRGAETSSDIDIMTPDDFDVILKELTDLKCKFYVYSKGEDKMSLLCKFDIDKFKRFVKLDFFKFTKKDFVFQYAYLTGSKNFNIIMRRQAQKMGYLLNQKGLYKILPDRKIESESVPVKNEKELFKILEMPYKTPMERNIL